MRQFLFIMKIHIPGHAFILKLSWWCQFSWDYMQGALSVLSGWPNCSGSAGASVVAHSVALPLIEIAFSTLDCSIVPTCGAWGSATAAKRGPLKQSWAVIQHSRDGEPLGVLMQMRNVRVNGFFFFSSLGVLPGVLADTPSLCCGNSISSFKRNTTDWTLDQAWGLMKSSYYFVTNVGSKCVNRHPFVV